MSKENVTLSVLVVEDDLAIVTLLRYNLEKAGFSVRSTHNGEEALFMIDEEKPDIILLDWMLPGISGIEICKRIRKKDETANIPVIMLSARGEESDRIQGLEQGVDDYLVKPFSPKELLARINAVLRRIRPSYVTKELSYGDIKMNLSTHVVTFKDTELKIGPTEYKLLQAFLEQPKRVLSRDNLIRIVWGDTFEVEPRTIDVHINRLRNVLNIDGNMAVIKTVRSAGYCLQNLEYQSFDPLDDKEYEKQSFEEEE